MMPMRKRRRGGGEGKGRTRSPAARCIYVKKGEKREKKEKRRGAKEEKRNAAVIRTGPLVLFWIISAENTAGERGRTMPNFGGVHADIRPIERNNAGRHNAFSSV